jgi:uncharacterized surface protein with fasciclin (FAS1) repeats
MLHFLKTKPWLFILFLALISSCKDKDELYERPGWLKGNAWEVLSDRSDMSIFLQAIEKSGYKDLVNGKGIITVMAPTDDAMQTYLTEKGYTSISEMPATEIKKLVGYHLLYYSFTQEQLANYQPDGQTNASEAYYGLYYKFRTKSKDTIESILDVTDVTYKKVIHKERFLPVFSSYLFSTKGISAEYNYKYFYPSSTWAGDGGGFNVSNASVSEYAIATDNGYAYIIDKVIEPLETVHTELKEESDYSTFISMYDRFATFWYDESATEEYASAGDSLYVFKHTDLPLIASEWSYNGESSLADYADLATLAYKAFNVFAPDNTALSSFFDEFWKGYYPSIDSVDFLPIAYLLYNHVYQGNIVFPTEISNGSITSAYGNVISFDPDKDVAQKKICSNGTFYGLSSVIVPPMFKSITGPLFQNKSYRMFLYMLSNVSLIQPLMSDAIENTIFVPSDDVILNTLYQNSYIYWDGGNPLEFGDEAIQVENTEGEKVSMGTKAMTRFVNNHIATEKITEISGTKIYRTRNSFEYLYVTDAGVASSSTYNLSTFANAAEIIGDWTNGKVYEVNTALIPEEGTFKSQIGTAASSTSSLNDFSGFSALLSSAGLLESNNEFSFLLGDTYVLFAPSNDAITTAAANGLIPSDATELANYLKKYFIPVSLNSLSDYLFVGSGITGKLYTAQPDGSGYTYVTLTDTGSILEVTNPSGTTASIINIFPKIYADGAVYLINSVL